MSKEQYGSEMSESAIADSLEAQGLGTLSMGNESGGYGIPMSFGFDRSQNRCLLQISEGEGNLKTDFLEEGGRVSLSTFEWESIDEWRSVIVRGTIKQISDEEIPKAAGIFAAQAKIASLDVFHQPIEDMDLVWYEIQIEEKHGRQASTGSSS
jgi:nitroimidazol reductase NimA-like FMN-containing flavoprotein (pyridoxamine 5'-phosphate oxidase superfamily)